MNFANEVGNQSQELDLYLVLQYNKRVQKEWEKFLQFFFLLNTGTTKEVSTLVS